MAKRSYPDVSGGRKPRRPELRFEPDRHIAFGRRIPFDHWPLDHTGVGQHDGAGAGRVEHCSLGGWIEFAPGVALAIEQSLPGHGGEPLVELRKRDTLHLEIVKPVFDALVGQPLTGFLDGVAVTDAVQSN